MNENRRRAIVLIWLVCIFGLSLFIRFRIYNNSKTSDFVPFSNVCAFHYYFTARIASGNGVAAVDYRVQHPEGLAVFKCTSIFMEYVLGYLYRGLRYWGVSLDSWVRFFVRFWGTLPVFAVYIIARRLNLNRLSASLSAAFYGFAPAAISRTLGFGLLRENFSLPVIFAHLVFVVIYLKDKRCYQAVLAGLLLFIALASWHFTQFYFLLLVIFVLVGFLRDGKQDSLMRLFLWLVGWSVLAGLVVPYLRANYFLFSFPMIVSYALIITGLLVSRARWGWYGHKYRFLIFILTSLLFLAVSYPYLGQQKAYSHVWNLGFYHLRYLFGKPEDPSRLPFSAKILWDISHTAPSIREIVINFGILILASAVPMALALRSVLKGRTDKAEKMMIYLLFIFMVLYLFINRLMVFIVFFLCLYAGGIASLHLKSKMKALASGTLGLLLLIEGVSTAGSRVIISEPPYVVDMLGWIRDNTGLDDVILSSPRSSPDILAYTGRPIILHAKLESKQIRDKTREWAERLFITDEDRLYELCKRWGVNWFVFPVGTYTNTGPSSWRYITDNLDEDRNTVGYKLEALPFETEEDEFTFSGARYKVKVQTGFHQPDLNHFRLFYKNKYFNIYKVE